MFSLNLHFEKVVRYAVSAKVARLGMLLGDTKKYAYGDSVLVRLATSFLASLGRYVASLDFVLSAII